MSIVSIINTIFDTTKKQNIPGARKTTHLIFKAIMGINHLTLSLELIAALYPESLVDAGNAGSGAKKVQTKATSGQREPDLSYMGKNGQSICFWVSYPDEEFIPEEPFIFLKKILAACKCTLDDIALVNAKAHPAMLESLKKQFQPRILFLWGAIPAITGLNQGWPDMEISTWENISIVPVLQADLMGRENPEGLALKRRLWISLKKLFSL